MVSRTTGKGGHAGGSTLSDGRTVGTTNMADGPTASGCVPLLTAPWRSEQLAEICSQLHRKVVVCQQAVRRFIARQRLRRKMHGKRRTPEDCRRPGGDTLGLHLYRSLKSQTSLDGTDGGGQLHSETTPRLPKSSHVPLERR
uniref:unconventional myosin-XVI-like n=1 Tax=Myxine glutinosa TaxID=7769 RepID=UPI00358EC3B8